MAQVKAMRKKMTKQEGHDEEGQKVDMNLDDSSSSNNQGRCKKYRNKKRKEWLELHTQNNLMKKERSILKNEIAELQVELYTMEGEGAMELQKQNDLLKTEISKYQEYIDKVLDPAKTLSLNLDSLEQQRLLDGAVDRNIATVVGIMRNSLSSPNSSWSPTKELHLHESLRASYSYEYLPKGCKPSEATYVNLRFDVHLDKPADLAFNHLCEFCRKLHGSFGGHDVNMVNQPTKAKVDPSIAAIKPWFVYLESSSIALPFEDVMTFVPRHLNLDGSVFRNPERFDQDRGPITYPCSALVIASWHFAKEDMEPEIDISRAKEGESDAVVVCSTGENSSTLTVVKSQRWVYKAKNISKASNSTSIELPDSIRIVDQAGNVSPILVDLYHNYLVSLAEATG